MLRAFAVAGLLLCTLGCASGPDVRTYNIGDRVQTGPLLYVVYETSWAPTLGLSDTPRVPANRFLIVRLSITNTGAEAAHVPSFLLIDDRGQNYTELSDGTGVPDWLGIARKLTPLASEKGAVAFDVPPAHYKLRVTDEAEQITSYVDLPLNLGASSKDL